ncbi:phosphoribosyltransferase [Niastella yeongjuensis]|uniref:Phosphoribosyltransferase n=1 Tax=Niastella yeongjuensis TaxID=354355 RepID=A0A1V9DYH5_9BACT|nr:phosphoribosyltransferase family protein [Niastella yeongjuensis]OQP38814.1 phosphoribosyltransferase [Niastella yeongjuensis]SEO31500.1 Predicted phosphoribosyltransferase [Niastella yeongjuensis]
MTSKPIFQDRIDAGLALCQHLQHYKHVDGIVLAVPRGGVPVALPVAGILQLPLELILSKKIGHPMHKEFAIGAVSLTGQVLSPNAFASDEYIQQETLHIRQQLRAMYKKFMGNKQPTPIKGKIVIVIDDGVATGNTLLSTLEMIKKEGPKKLVIAVPVASKQAAQKLSEVVDEFVCVWIPSHFRSVGEFYSDFTQVSDEDVITMLTPPK